MIFQYNDLTTLLNSVITFKKENYQITVSVEYKQDELRLIVQANNRKYKTTHTYCLMDETELTNPGVLNLFSSLESVSIPSSFLTKLLK